MEYQIIQMMDVVYPIGEGDFHAWWWYQRIRDIYPNIDTVSVDC